MHYDSLERHSKRLAYIEKLQQEQEKDASWMTGWDREMLGWRVSALCLIKDPCVCQC